MSEVPLYGIHLLRQTINPELSTLKSEPLPDTQTLFPRVREGFRTFGEDTITPHTPFHSGNGPL